MYGSAPDEYAKFLAWCDNALDHLHLTNAPLRDLLHGITPHQLMGAELLDDGERILRGDWMVGDRGQLFLAPGPRTIATPTATSIRERYSAGESVELQVDDDVDHGWKFGQSSAVAGGEDLPLFEQPDGSFDRGAEAGHGAVVRDVLRSAFAVLGLLQGTQSVCRP